MVKRIAKSGVVAGTVNFLSAHARENVVQSRAVDDDGTNAVLASDSPQAGYAFSTFFQGAEPDVTIAGNAQKPDAALVEVTKTQEHKADANSVNNVQPVKTTQAFVVPAVPTAAVIQGPPLAQDTVASSLENAAASATESPSDGQVTANVMNILKDNGLPTKDADKVLGVLDHFPDSKNAVGEGVPETAGMDLKDVTAVERKKESHTNSVMTAHAAAR